MLLRPLLVEVVNPQPVICPQWAETSPGSWFPLETEPQLHVLLQVVLAANVVCYLIWCQ